jgi:hypothetical protein
MQLQIIALFLVPNFSLHVLSGQRCTIVIQEQTEQKEKGFYNNKNKNINYRTNLIHMYDIEL